jgi:hypothetical protein
MSKMALSANTTGSGIFTIASPSGNTNRTLTLPDATTTLVGTDNTQFLTNKSFIGTTLFAPTSATDSVSLEVGGTRTGDGASFIDLIGDTTYTDFGTRLIRNSGSSGSTNLAHRGTGDLIISTLDTSSIAFRTQGTERMRISANGNVGIGTTDPGTTKLRISNANSTNYSLIVQSPTVGLTAGNFTNIAYFTDGRALNNDGLRVVNLRDSTASGGSDWQTSSFRIRRSVDQNDGSTGVQEEIVFGDSILAFNTADSERMRIDSGGLITQVNATSGRGAIVGEQTFRLAANGSALGPTIADFFGATSSISLEASSVYQITAYCVFTKTTAGTIAWTMTASSAPTRMVGTYMGSPVTGIAAGAPISGFTGSQGATTAAFGATASLTTAVNHAFQITMQVQTNAATNFRMRITNGAGTSTPLAGSYYTVKKISASTGTFAA